MCTSQGFIENKGDEVHENMNTRFRNVVHFSCCLDFEILLSLVHTGAPGTLEDSQ